MSMLALQECSKSTLMQSPVNVTCLALSRQTNGPHWRHEINIMSSARRSSAAEAGSTLIITSNDSDTHRPGIQHLRRPRK